MRWGLVVAIVVVVAACSGFQDASPETPLPEDKDCPPGQSRCDDLCVDLQTANAHCGDCTKTCAPTESCTAGQCTGARQCAAGTAACGDACVDLAKDSSNCGVCGKTCAEKEECRAGSCVTACKKVLNQPLTDPWGGTWDGLERAPSTFADAQKTCEGLNGRLPLPSELLHVSAVRSATVGQTSHVNPLWSLAPARSGVHMTLRLSDAATYATQNATMTRYRCTCPPEIDESYGDKSCFGPAGAACFSLSTEAKHIVIDKEDRATLPKGAAAWECAYQHGRIATPLQILEAVTNGIGTGSGAFLHVADDVTSQHEALAGWTDPSVFVLDYTGGQKDISWSNTSIARPFRCAGTSFAAGTHPATIADEIVMPGSHYKSETKDSAVSAWASASVQCFGRGGHVPTRTELMTLVSEGLPNGTNTQQWTSDQCGYDGNDFLLGTGFWLAAPSAAPYEYPDDITWAYKTGTRAFRCIYYPVDAAYQGPAASACNGGCFEVKLPGTSGAKMWFDAADRSPPDTLTKVARNCNAAGGRLASERDFLEAIRAGLPGGSGAPLHTSDLQTDFPPMNVYASSIHWTGIDPAFDDLWDGGVGRVFTTAARAYRCMWTNELR